MEEAERYYDKGVIVTRVKTQIEKKRCKAESQRDLYNSFLEFCLSAVKTWKMELGWKLYEHGLNAPAEGAQKWQRAFLNHLVFQKLKIGGVKIFPTRQFYSLESKELVILWHF